MNQEQKNKLTKKNLSVNDINQINNIILPTIDVDISAFVDGIVNSIETEYDNDKTRFLQDLWGFYQKTAVDNYNKKYNNLSSTPPNSPRLGKGMTNKRRTNKRRTNKRKKGKRIRTNKK